MGICVNFFGKFLGFGSFGAKFAEFLSENSSILQKKREFFMKFTQIRVNLSKNSAQTPNFKGGAKWQD